MNIVLEGPDGGGKSILAALLAEYLGFDVQAGEGPPKGPGEINERAARYLRLEETIFDRHPCVSQPIYEEVRLLKGVGYFEEKGPSKTKAMAKVVPDEGRVISPAVMERFYEARPLLIYCRSLDASRHVVKAHEDPAHIEAVNAGYSHLVKLYDKWALEHAHVIYRIGDSIDELCVALEARYRERTL